MTASAPRTSELTALDRAFLCMESDTAPMHVGAVAVFRPDGPIDRDRLRELLAARAARIGRLRMRLENSWVQPHWRESARFDATEHVQDHHVPAPGGREELAALVSELVAEPLERDRPLWELHVITGLAEDRFAVLVKFHHALVDGREAVQVGLRLLDGYTDLSDDDDVPLRNPLDEAFELVRNPARLLGTLRETLSSSSEALGIAASVVRNVRRPVQHSPLHAPTSAARRLALVPVDLADIRRIRARHGGTTNDAVLAVITGALRRWLDARGQRVEDVPARALIPVCRRARKQTDGGNQLSGYLCELPVAEPDPATRLRLIREEMSRHKGNGPLRGPGAFPVLAGRLPQLVHQFATPVAGQGAPLLFDTMVTNVPLPNLPAAIDGADLAELYPVAPLAAGHALAIAVSQYRDAVHIGVQANRAALPDLEKLSEALPQAVAELDDGA
ncbi:wax ester/triacylglycerol synthase family O-acyltransferase [Saccharopolyspora griseoalba]|uniref:Diacylglycerol O-acyltransferase n=1 Tax=Saccharopolyspora griseoalba TaxID=1431848 RepID=A0ABW2LFC9_9PSEU